MTGYTNQNYDQIAISRQLRKAAARLNSAPRRRAGVAYSIPELWALSIDEKKNGPMNYPDCSLKTCVTPEVIKHAPGGNARPARSCFYEFVKLAALVLLPAVLTVFYLGKCAGKF